MKRAKHHLGDFCDRIDPRPRKPLLPGAQAIEPHEQTTAYFYRVKMPESDDPLLPIIAGDLMFNIRSALDHVFVALVPEDAQSKSTAYPIFTDDLDALDPVTGKHLEVDAWGAWRSKTAGAPGTQWPSWNSFTRTSSCAKRLTPKYSSFSILSAFQNADKHRNLVLVGNGLRDPMVWQIHPDGSRVRVGPEEVDPPSPWPSRVCWVGRWLLPGSSSSIYGEGGDGTHLHLLRR